MRNPTALAFNPDTGDLYATVQERDGLGDNLVPDYFTHVQQGAFYGWPYSYIGQHPQPAPRHLWRAWMAPRPLERGSNRRLTVRHSMSS